MRGRRKLERLKLLRRSIAAKFRFEKGGEGDQEHEDY